MSDTQDRKLDAMLQSRRFEPASPDLAARIALQARSVPQNQTITPTQWMKRLFSEFHLPRPVYVFACILIFGFVVGFNSQLDTPTTDDADTVDVQSFLYADEDPL